MTTPAPTQQMREKFEQWFDALPQAVFKAENFQRRSDGDYEMPDTRAAWKVWQSAHQCGREERQGEIIEMITALSTRLYGEIAEGDQIIIERIQGGK